MKIISAIAAMMGGLIVGSDSTQLYRLALFEPTDTLDALCGLDSVGQTARYFTVVPTTACTVLPGSDAAFGGETKYYSWSNVSGNECFRAGCDSRCRTCEVEQGVCSGGSGSGTTTRPQAVDRIVAIMSDELLTCGSTVSGDTRDPGLSFMGNPTPDRIHTLQLDHATTVHLDACAADFEATVKVFSTDEEDGTEPLLSCKGCEDCSAEFEAGEYALLVEGDENQARTAGIFNVNVDCGSSRRARAERIPVMNDDDTTVQLNKCYTKADTDGFHSFFVFKMDSMDKTQQACVIEQNADRARNSTIKLAWAGINATCDTRSDEGATIIASVIGGTSGCLEGSDGLYSEVNQTGQNFSVRFECQDDGCMANDCNIVQNNVLPGSCFGSRYEVVKARHFSTCSLNPGESTGSPATTLRPNPQPLHDKKKSPVGAIVGGVVGVLVVAGIVFFVIRKRKQMNATAYSTLNDGLTTDGNPFSSD